MNAAPLSSARVTQSRRDERFVEVNEHFAVVEPYGRQPSVALPMVASTTLERSSEVALYEIVLRFPDRDETRLDDRGSYAPAAEVVIDDQPYVVIGTELPQGPNVEKRFVLVPAEE